MNEWFGVSVEGPEQTTVLHCVAPEPVKPKLESKPKPESKRRYGPKPSITVRRAEVLDLLVAGYSSVEISVRLGISVKTLRNHVSAVSRLLGARNRVQAAVTWALKRQGGA